MRGDSVCCLPFQQRINGPIYPQRRKEAGHVISAHPAMLWSSSPITSARRCNPVIRHIRGDVVASHDVVHPALALVHVITIFLVPGFKPLLVGFIELMLIVR